MSFLNADLPSSDEEDEDYDAANDRGAEREDLDPSLKKKLAKKRTQRRGVKRGRAAAQGAEAEAAAEDDEGEDDEEEEEEEIEAAVPVHKVLAKKAKIEAVWQMLNSREAGGSNATAAPTHSISIAALCGRSQEKVIKSDLTWQQQLKLQAPELQYKLFGNGGTTVVAAAAAAEGGLSTGAGQNDAGQAGPSSSLGSAAVAVAAAAGAAPSSSGRVEITPQARASAAAALAAAKEAASTGLSKVYNKVAVTETRRFAGQDIQVTVQVDKDKAATQAKKPAVSSGLDRFLAELEKKKKVNILDKSKMDWNHLKTTDVSMESELETHKKSSNKYLEKVAFLKNAELREYEIERDKRLQGDVRLRNRL